MDVVQIVRQKFGIKINNNNNKILKYILVILGEKEEVHINLQ